MRAVVITGSTASGKSGISLETAGLDFEIVSADSVQVYTGLDIGSGKLSLEERMGIPHHMIDIAEPDYAFTAGDFCTAAADVCAGIDSRNRIPMFVGGTGLYIDSFFDGLSDIPQVEPDVRKILFAEADKRGLDELYAELAVIDPVFASRIHPHDRQRILRGLEVFRSSGNPISFYFFHKRGALSEKTVFIGIFIERAELIKRINIRVDSMFAAGLADEVKALREKGFGPECKSMRSIGYHETGIYLDGRMKLHEAVNLMKSNTVKYAKRQMTWFRKNKRTVWFNGGETEKIKRFISSCGVLSV